MANAQRIRTMEQTNPCSKQQSWRDTNQDIEETKQIVNTDQAGTALCPWMQQPSLTYNTFRNQIVII